MASDGLPTGLRDQGPNRDHQGASSDDVIVLLTRVRGEGRSVSGRTEFGPDLRNLIQPPATARRALAHLPPPAASCLTDFLTVGQISDKSDRFSCVIFWPVLHNLSVFN